VHRPAQGRWPSRKPEFWVSPDGRSTRPGITDAAIAALCGYEIAAICSGERLPTLSRMQSRYRLLGCALVGALTWHFVRYNRAS
jgi:hypothetical protein